MSKFCVRPHLMCLREHSAAPILLRFPLHRRSRRVLHLKPIGRAAGAVGGIRALWHNAFKAELATIDARVVLRTSGGTRRSSSSPFRSIRSKAVGAVVTDQIKRRNAVFIAGDSFAID